MSTDPGQDLQKAIFERLGASAALQALIGNPARLYDHVDPSAVFPFVRFGEIVVTDWSNKSFPGADSQITLHVFSRGRGRKETRAILDMIFGLLHDVDLTLEAHVLVALRFEFSQVALDEDGLTYHGIVRYRARTQQNA